MNTKKSGCFYVCEVKFECSLDGVAQISLHTGYNMFDPYFVQISEGLRKGNAFRLSLNTGIGRTSQRRLVFCGYFKEMYK